MERVDLEYTLDVVPYFCSKEGTYEDPEKSQGYKKYRLEEHQCGIIGYVIEAFAAHCLMLLENVKVNSRRKVSVAVAEDLRILEHNRSAYLCMPDSCIEDLDGLKRGVSEDIASLNWYAYNAAREAVLEWVEFNADSGYKLQHRSRAQDEIADFEWRNIKKILSYTHLFDYPRPSDDRIGYLANCGVTEVPLVLL